MAMQSNPPAALSAGSTVDPAEIAKFSKLSEQWWDPKGKMAPLHKINPLRLTYIRDAACRKFERNVKSLNCLSGLRILDIGCGAAGRAGDRRRPVHQQYRGRQATRRSWSPVDRLSLHHRRRNGRARTLRH